MNPAPNTYEYLDFDLLIGGKSTGGYPVTVVESPAGEGETCCHLQIDNELRSVLYTIEERKTDPNLLMAFGSRLFDELFAGDVLMLYRTSLGIVRHEEKCLRLRLRINAPELAALPWEYLYDPKECGFLATSRETALVRHMPLRLSARPTAIQLPLRVLAVLASPNDLRPLNIEQEKAILCEALGEWIKRGEVELQFLEHATIGNVSQAIRWFQPHVFHFVGHGQFDRDRALIVLEDEENAALPVDERTFQEFFSGAQETRLVVLNACQTATLSTSQPLAGLAPRLLQRQLSGVVAMQYPISEQASLIFAREFYRSLAEGYPIEAAVAEARKGLYQELGAEQPDWGTPVLFLRAESGQLFQAKLEASTSEDGTSNNANLNGITPTWSQTVGSGVILTDSTTSTIQFTANPVSEPALLRFQLTVSASNTAKNPDKISIAWQPAKPIMVGMMPRQVYHPLVAS
jgi:hypothetical protein